MLLQNLTRVRIYLPNILKGRIKLGLNDESGTGWQNETLKLWYSGITASTPLLILSGAMVLTLGYAINHYCDVVMGAMSSQITSLTIVYSIVHSGADQRKHQSSASLAFVRGIHRWPVNSPHKGPVTRKMFPFDDVIMNEDIDNL